MTRRPRRTIIARVQTTWSSPPRRSPSRLWLCLLIAVAGIPAGAQILADLSDGVYEDLALWESRGIIAHLPGLRPYPPQLVADVMRLVIGAGDDRDAARARQYLEDLESPRVHLSAGGSFQAATAATSGAIQSRLEAQQSITGTVAYSVAAGGVAEAPGLSAALPSYQRTIVDEQHDTAVTTLGSTNLTPRLSLSSLASVGTPEFYLLAGVTRLSYGPIRGDSLVLSPTAPQAGQISIVLEAGPVTVTSLLADITATNGDGSGTPQPEKFLAFHSLEVALSSALSLAVFESVVWGGRFEPLYLLPVPSSFYYVQGLAGFHDNSFLGMSLAARFPGSLSAGAVLYVDDASFNDLARLQLNTMLVVAGQAQVQWTPHTRFLESVGLTYTMLTPYIYTHKPDDAGSINYVNYTNGGQNMGTSLLPDSDRLEVAALSRPLSNLEIEAFGRFIRHGNGSEGIPGGGDGTLFDDGYVGGTPTFTPSGNFPLPAGMRWTRFLSQSMIESTLQLGASPRLRLATPFGDLSLGVSYTFQYTWNPGLVSGAAASHFLGVTARYRY
jgi:hypothetical protein